MLCAAMLLLAAPASAHDKKHAKVFKAKLEATDAAKTAGIPDARGRAHLVDGRKHDKVSLHVKGLEPGETYLWKIHAGHGGAIPAQCAPSATRPYPAGPTACARAATPTRRRARRASPPTRQRWRLLVEVQLEDGTVVASGDFERKRRGHEHGDKPHGKPGDDDSPGEGARRARQRQGRRPRPPRRRLTKDPGGSCPCQPPGLEAFPVSSPARPGRDRPAPPLGRVAAGGS